VAVHAIKKRSEVNQFAARIHEMQVGNFFLIGHGKTVIEFQKMSKQE
jgi:hypothetical protein